MAESFTLAAEQRTRMGSAECRRLRRQGSIPGNLYGHKQTPVPIRVSAEAVESLVTHGHRVVDLELGGSVEKALFQEVQWDPLGIRIQHFDLLRVDAEERVSVDVPIELKGTAPGVVAGGMLEQPLHELAIECPAVEIPESVVVRISSLQIGQAIHVSDLELPPSVTVETPGEQVIVQVVHPVAEPEPAEEALAPAEPELIGRKPADDEAGEA